MTQVLKVEELFVDFGEGSHRPQPVRGVSFDVAAGETLCIVGESGSGKSLTALAVMGLLPPGARRRAGRLTLQGADILVRSEREMSDLRGDRMSMIFQDPMSSLNPSLTVGRQLTEVMIRHRAVTHAAACARAVELLEMAGVAEAEERLRQFPHQLSGGLRQRVMIAMSLMCTPSLLIADEPTTALDVTIQAQILKVLKEMQRHNGTALLMITHDLGVVAQVADRVAVMYAGQIVEIGPIRQVVRSPRHPYTRALVACLPKPVLNDQALGTIPGSVPMVTAASSGCGFANRCTRAMPACDSSADLDAAAQRHGCRCIDPSVEVVGHARSVP